MKNAATKTATSAAKAGTVRMKLTKGKHGRVGIEIVEAPKQTLVDGLTAAQRSSATTERKKRDAAIEAAKVAPKTPVKSGPPVSADAGLVSVEEILAATSKPKPTLASVKADTAKLRAAGKAPAAKPEPAPKTKAAPKAASERPVTNGHCSKCGRYNDPLWPECETKSACDNRIKVGKEYIAHIAVRDGLVKLTGKL